MNNRPISHWRRRAVLLPALLCLAWPAAAAKWEKLEQCTLAGDEYMDGDSFHVRHQGKDYIFRLYFVDAPETDTTLEDRIGDQADYFGIPRLRVPKIGRRAARLTLKKLQPGFTVYTQWADAMGSSAQQRFFGVVKIGKRDLAEMLVEEGLARVYGESIQLPDGTMPDMFFDRLRRLEQQARQKKRGVWGTLAAAPDEDEDHAPAAPAEEETTPAGGWPNVPTVAYLRAEAYVNMERFEEAEPELHELLQRYPSHPQKARIEFYLALSIAMQERFKEAIALFHEWLAVHPDDLVSAEVNYWLPIALYYDGQYEEALKGFQAYLAKYTLTVYAPEAEYRAALCRYALEDYEACAAALAAWIERHPDHYFRWEARIIRGDALAALGRLEEARDAYLGVTGEAGSFHFLALSQAAKVFKALGTEQDYRDMAAVFARFIQDQPESGNVVDAAYQAGLALRHIGRLAEARQLYWTILARYGNNPKWEGFDLLLQDLSVLYSDQPPGELDRELRDRFTAALREKRFTLAGRLGLPELQAAAPSDRTASALALAAQFNLEYMAPELLAWLGDTLTKGGRTDKAKVYLDKLLQSFPDSRFAPLAHTRAAEQCLLAQDYSNAVAHADQALAYGGEPQLYMEAILARARGLQGLKQYPEAVEMYNQVLANRAAPRPMKPEAILGIAACFTEQGKAREAIPYYQRIYVLYRAYPGALATAYLKSAEAFEQIRDLPAALRTYRELVDTPELKGTPEWRKAQERLSQIAPAEKPS